MGKRENLNNDGRSSLQASIRVHITLCQINSDALATGRLAVHPHTHTRSPNEAVQISTNEYAQNFIISLSVRIGRERNFRIILASMEPFSIIQVGKCCILSYFGTRVIRVRRAHKNKFLCMKSINTIMKKMAIGTSAKCRHFRPLPPHTLNGCVTNQKWSNFSPFFLAALNEGEKEMDPLVYASSISDHRYNNIERI